MKTYVSKKGSALLVVLGMLSFMVISAVAFSAYMRTSRLPSSYLRRVVGSRMLVKAAMAEAIEEVDAAIGNFPHPGVWNQASYSSSDIGLKGSRHPGKSYFAKTNNNVWIGRVLIGNGTGAATVENCLLPQEETVSPLCLEALAYMPPSLLNQARYYSRHSSAAKWHMMDFESGRYSFCALDVSDYFDINVLTADNPRSTDPNARISLSYLFEEANVDEGKWDNDFVGNVLKDANVPFFVSMADWNLSFYKYNNNGLGAFKSYFCEYVKDGSTLNDVYGGSEAFAKNAGYMPFVTDGWFPLDAKKESGDLLKPNDENQPFNQYVEKKSYELGWLSITSCEETEPGNRLAKTVPLAVKAALFDYLDPDDVPVSLSLPTVERAPMICGIQLEAQGAEVKLVCEDASTPKQISPEEQEVTRTIKIYIGGEGLSDFAKAPSASILPVYPFRHEKDQISVKLDGSMAYFFTYGDMSLRPTKAVDALKYQKIVKDNNGVPAPFSNGVMGWNCKESDSVFFPSQLVSTENNAFLLGNDDGTMTLVSDEDAFKKIGVELKDTAYLLDAKFVWRQTKDPNTGGWVPDFDTAYKDGTMAVTASSGFKALETTGEYDKDKNIFLKKDKELVEALKNGAGPIKLNFAVWARFVSTAQIDGKVRTYDLVPACVDDDKLNELNDDRQEIYDNFGKCTPLLRFDTGVTLSVKLKDDCTLDTSNGGDSGTVKLSPSAIIARDPRYNYAPENWCAYSKSVTKANWLVDNGAKDADGDIFMQVSNMGRMQSVYELANLPRLGNAGFGEFGQSVQGNLEKPDSYTGTSFPDLGQEVNAKFFWKTYDPFGRYKTNGDRVSSPDDIVKHSMKDYEGKQVDCIGDGFEHIGIFSDWGGFKVNPYSDSTNVIMTALANAPHAWRFASSYAKLSGADYYDDHAWNEESSGAKMYMKNIEEAAACFIRDLRSSEPNGRGRSTVCLGEEYEETWESVFRNLGWCDPGNANQAQYLLPDRDEETMSKLPDLLSQDNSSDTRLSNTDRKFLYGFWHDCFAVKQQLFLVFVRAEPSLMGGGAVGHTPPQLGARAVALVWRDPVDRSTDKNKMAPHKTRILFYRQFD